MRDLPPGLATDLAILEHSGSIIEYRGDHVTVRSPSNPDFHWGNCIFVTDAHAVNDAAGWVATFRSTFPEADWVALGLIRMPDDEGAWATQGLALEVEEALTARTLPPQAPVPDGYTVRRFDGEDWERSMARAVAENLRTGEYDAPSQERFLQAQATTRRGLSQREAAAWFGAFDGDLLVAELGIVRCGTTARYQSVGTNSAHQRRGLASHLLGVAARWAADEGCDRWVIVTEATNPAGRVYRSLGFTPDISSVTAYRPPRREGH